MAMDKKWKQRLVWLAVVLVVIALRVAWVLYDRNQPARVRPTPQRILDKDYLVVVPKFHVDDLESAKKLIGKRLWVKAGYQASYFPWPLSARAGLSKPAIFFEPMETFVVEDVKERPLSPGSLDREALFLFKKNDGSYAIVVGFYLEKDQQYQMELDELFFSKNPTELYSHWSPQAWERVKAHQLEKGMSFAQASLSIGSGQLIMTGAGGAQVYEFSRKPGGMPGKTRVRFVEGKVEEIEVRE